jgi:transcriptional antiterminator RfaH
MNWYALHTKPRAESLAQSNLQRQAIKTFLPRLRRKKTIRRRYRWTTGPLFPGYIFARFDFDRHGRLVKYANGITNVVSFGGTPAVVEDAIIEAIHAHCEPDTDTVTLPPPELRPGDRVQVREGPLTGLEGIFEHEMSDRDRVVILLETIGRGARAQIQRAQLEKL